MALLSAQQISKSFGAIQALRTINIDFEDENIYGLFGRNGAGKTTLLDILAGRNFADNGIVTCEGKNIVSQPEILANQCCYMAERSDIPGWLPVKTLLAYAAKSFPNYNKALQEHLCKTFELNCSQKFKQLSKGYQSIFRIILGLSSGARITILDEPVLGLDAVARDTFYQELIQNFTENPRLIIISTHLIEESADLFNKAIIMQEGEIIRQESVATLLENAFYVSGSSDRVDAFIANHKVISSSGFGDMKTAVVEGQLAKQAATPGLRFSSLTIQKLFIHLTNRAQGE